MKTSKVSCELCSLEATTYCESDEAKLCWKCDSKVHKANFLVNKHSRILLCQLCQNITPWSASGPMLPPCLSLCLSCATPATTTTTTTTTTTGSEVDDYSPRTHHHHDDDDDDGCDSYDDDDHAHDDDDGEDDDDEEEDEDNQVVPLTTTSSIEDVVDDDDGDGDDVHDDGGDVSPMIPSSLKRKRECYMLS